MLKTLRKDFIWCLVRFSALESVYPIFIYECIEGSFGYPVRRRLTLPWCMGERKKERQIKHRRLPLALFFFARWKSRILLQVFFPSFLKLEGKRRKGKERKKERRKELKKERKKERKLLSVFFSVDIEEKRAGGKSS